MIARSERLLTHSREYLRCWIRRPTAIIVFQKPLSKRWGLFLLSTQMSVSLLKNAMSTDILQNCRFCRQKKTLSRGRGIVGESSRKHLLLKHFSFFGKIEGVILAMLRCVKINGFTVFLMYRIAKISI